jgi:ammonium transporter Rh
MRKLGPLLIALQVTILVAYAFLVRYEDNTDADKLHNTYAYFQDVHLMIFIGFGYLMTFLRRYGYGAVGFNMLLAAIAIELSILAQS